MKKTQVLLWCLIVGFAQKSLQAQTVYDQIDKQTLALEAKVIEWRRDLHQNPELSNREFKTAEKVAAHLRSLGLEVRTGVAKTGVIGILRTGKPGPVVGLRADMDALPVVERVKIPFASKVKADYRGEDVGVMHACGHDTHVAMLMGAASILTGIKSQLAGTVVFIFQPAEEGPPPGETGGAKLMVEEGLLKDLKMNIVFGQHISSIIEVGNINIRPGGLMAAADRYVIKVKGKQTHGSQPWSGIDPVTVAAQIVLGLQTIVSRQMELTREAAVISVGKISGGVRNNIIPEEVELEGTIRTLDVDMQTDLHERIRRTATNIAEASGAVAEVEIFKHVPITFNNPELFTKMGPTLKRVCGEDNVIISRAVTGAEDFAFFANEVPSMFYFVGGMPKGQDPKTAPPHHTPDFYVDEAGMGLGVRLFCNLVVDYTTKLK
ncbi:amidohydrolase [Haliscomenobacter hydrossis]|uniref:Amidohydrolase n=1 Tax=Haliscomenobacter hydrossis (strain ATCC 27775 / DSM 1100 / LMG 10767 / O) TaxID=760192 RepID=F4KWY0_HALH1|nr:amidohydrolase [Haliscomenobacter hydrossis]AEE53580.1 amidohydrolase [Haliscomenobacter hydrossis DSM 1100]